MWWWCSAMAALGGFMGSCSNDWGANSRPCHLLLNDSVETRRAVDWRLILHQEHSVGEAQGVGQRYPINKVRAGLRHEVWQCGWRDGAAIGIGCHELQRAV